MGKLLTVLLIIAVLAGGAVFVYQHMRGLQTVERLETIVPGDTIYYLYSYAPSKKVEQLYNSDFYQKVVNLSLYREFTAPALAKKEKVFSQLAELFDSDTACAVFSPQLFEMKEPGFNKQGAQIGTFLLFIRTSAGENIKAIIADLFLRSAEKQKGQYERYGGVRIGRYAFAEQAAPVLESLSYAQLGDIFVIGNDQEQLKKAIDLFKGNSTKSLANDSVFQALQKQGGSLSKEVLLWSMVNYKKYYKEIIASLLKEQASAEGGTAAAGLSGPFQDFIESFMGVMVGLVNVVDYDSARQGFLVTSHQLFDAGKDEEGFLSTFTMPAQEANPVLAMVPADALGYMGFRGNMSEYFQYFKNYFKKFSSSTVGMIPMQAPKSATAAASGSGFSGMLQGVDARLGVSLEKDVLPLLGEHMSFFLADIEEITMLPPEGEVNPLQLAPTPVPHFFLIAEAKNAAAAGTLQALLIDSMNAWQAGQESEELPQQPQQQEEVYKDITLKAVAVKDAPVLPVCFVIDRYCVFGSSAALAKKIIDTRSDVKNSLAARFNYQFDKKQLLANSSFTLFFDFKRVIMKIAAIKMVEFMKPTVGFFTKGAVRPEDVDAIFDVLDDITLVAQANRISEEAVGEGLFYVGVEGL